MRIGTRIRNGAVVVLAAWAAAICVVAQQPGPIAIVRLDEKNGAKVSGALEVAEGKAIIASSGSIEAGAKTSEILLPHRGSLRVCASTLAHLTADNSVPSGETPGLMISMERGAVEASFATGRNADVLMTPDFRILIGGPGAAEVKVRLGAGGDTCVDNGAKSAAYVLVSSVFEGGAYRVQAGQRVMFQHGSLREVVDEEKEPCGCPPEAANENDFPLAQSEGLAPLTTTAPAPAKPGQMAEALHYDGKSKSTTSQTEAVASNAAGKPVETKKSGILARVGRFLRRVFGAE